MKGRPFSELLGAIERQERAAEEARQMARGAAQDSGRALREARNFAGVSSSSLAAAAGVSKAYVYAVEQGRKVSSPDQLRRLHGLLAALAEKEGTHGDERGGRD